MPPSLLPVVGLLAVVAIVAAVFVVLRAMRSRAARDGRWIETARVLGLDPAPWEGRGLSMRGRRVLPVWLWIEERDDAAAVDPECETCCRVEFEPPFALGLALAPLARIADLAGHGAGSGAIEVKTGESTFDDRFAVLARDPGRAFRLLTAGLAAQVAAVAERTGAEVCIVDSYVELRLPKCMLDSAALEPVLDAAVELARKAIEVRGSASSAR